MTESQYNNNLEYLQRHDPTHRLLPKLERGYSRVNVIYLKKALDTMSESEPEPKAEKKEKPKANTDPGLKKLYIQKSNLFTERARLSNRFHELDTVESRASNSQQIQIIQRQIGKLHKSIAHYEEHGKLPDTKEEELYPLPDSSLGIDRKIKSIRAMISQEKKKIIALAEEADKKGVDAAEKRLSHLKNYLAYAENALKAKESA